MVPAEDLADEVVVGAVAEEAGEEEEVAVEEEALVEAEVGAEVEAEAEAGDFPLEAEAVVVVDFKDYEISMEKTICSLHQF